MDQIFEADMSLIHKLRALAAGPEQAAFLMKRVAEDLADRLSAVERKFENAAALFCLTPHAAQVIAESGKAEKILRIEEHNQFFDPVFNGSIAAHMNVPLEPESIDLAVSLLTLHEVDDLPGMLIQIRRSLKPDGLFLGALACSGTLQELRQSLLQAETEIYGGASPRVHPFADVRDIGNLLQRAGFSLPVADLETVTVRYDSMFDLMKDLRAMGATSALVQRSRKPATRAFFLRAAEIYQEQFSDADGRIRATFNFAWMSGWAPHESQQKPLKPGSATVSLAKVLSEEQSKKGS